MKALCADQIKFLWVNTQGHFDYFCLIFGAWQNMSIFTFSFVGEKAL